MDYEKKYKEALEKARQLCLYPTTKPFISDLKNLFPELAESEDEKIRESLLEYLHTLPNHYSHDGVCAPEWIAWLEKQGEQEQLYIRFGEIPTDEKSKIYQGEIEVGTENGVSVYPAFKTDEGDIVLGLSLPITKTTLYTQQHLIEYDDRPCYLVKGDYVGKDTDGQPLINNVSIIEKIGTYRAKEEKQGEQKPTDEIEPKFHEGDWVVISTSGGEKVVQIDSIEHFKSGEPMYITSEGRWFGNGTKTHLWTIQDAKDGDVLGVEPIKDCPDSFIAIYKERGLNFFNSYCFVSLDGEFNKGTTGHDIYLIHPATKEQRDTLFAKMTEAGYEWDAEKKELKKIEDEEYNGEDYGIDSLYHAQRILEKTLGSVDGYQTDDGILSHKCAITAVKKLYEQKPVWSEEDEDYYDAIVAKLEVTQDDTALTDNQMEFLKSLKSRVQLKQEWSEEDKERLTSCIQLLKTSDGFDTINTKWLKSLKERYTWKPSGEQMKALDNFIFAKYPNIEKYEKSVKSLYQDLMKLKT